MSQTKIVPHLGLEIRPEDQETLPLSSFQLYVFVEPSPPVWMRTQAEEAQYTREVSRLAEQIKAELRALPGAIPQPGILWIKSRQFPYTNPLIGEFGDLPFTAIADQAELEHLAYMITGISILHPQWRAAVIGAAQNLEVIRVGNVIQTNGLWATLLVRYCYPAQALQPYLTSA
jgi:hypothetical protein